MNTFVAVLPLVVVAFSKAEALCNCIYGIPLANGTLSAADVLLPPQQCNVTEDNIKLYYFYGDISKPFKIGETPFLENGAPNCSLRIYCHGWLPFNESSVKYVKVLVERGHQVILIDWSYYALRLYYLDAKECVLGVAVVIIRLLRTIPAELLRCLVLIGFSLGAHILGIASANTVPKPYRIEALDPPIILNAEPFPPLNETNAECVVMHQTSVLSCNNPAAHIHVIYNGDNGPCIQPGCIPVLGVMCNHKKSVQYYLDTVDPSSNKYIATRCDSWGQYLINSCNNNLKIKVGEYFNQSSCSQEGKYYVNTLTSIFPF